MLGIGVLTTILGAHGQLPPGMAEAALMGIAVSIDSTRLIPTSARPTPHPMDLVRLAVVGAATTILCLGGNLPPTFVYQALMAIAFPGDPTRWQRKGGSTP